MSHTSTGRERRGRRGLRWRIPFFRADRSIYWRHGQRWPRCHFKYQSASLGITCWLHFLPQGNYRHRASHRNSPRKNFFNDRRSDHGLHESFLNLPNPVSSPLFLISSPSFPLNPPFKTPFSFHSSTKTSRSHPPFLAPSFIPPRFERRKLHAPCKPGM